MQTTSQTHQIQCILCAEIYEITTHDNDLQKWRDGGLIQRVMPYLTENERELLISQICGHCFDRLTEDSE